MCWRSRGGGNQDWWEGTLSSATCPGLLNQWDWPPLGFVHSALSPLPVGATHPDPPLKTLEGQVSQASAINVPLAIGFCLGVGTWPRDPRRASTRIWPKPLEKTGCEPGAFRGHFCHCHHVGEASLRMESIQRNESWQFHMAPRTSHAWLLHVRP